MAATTITEANREYLALHGITPGMQTNLIDVILDINNLDAENQDQRTINLVLDAMTAGVMAYRKLEALGVR